MEATVTPMGHRSGVIAFPNDLEIVRTREFEAPIAHVFEVLAGPHHVRRWFAPFEDTMTVCSIDLRVGGTYRYVFMPPTDRVLVPRHLPRDRSASPHRRDMAVRWWPDVEAVRTLDVKVANGVTTPTLAFRDEVGRRHMTRTDGQEDSLDKLEDYLRGLVDPGGP